MATVASKRTRRRLLELACICLAVAQAGWFILPRLKPLVKNELAAQDQVVANGWRPNLADDFVFVALDESSLELDQLWPEEIEESKTLQLMSQTRFPWTRAVFADAVAKIEEAGARIVILDLIMNSPGPGDAELRQVLDKYSGRVVLASTLVNEERDGNGTAMLTFPSDTLIENPDRDPRVGYANFWPESDETVRTARYSMSLSEARGDGGHLDSQRYQSLAAATLKQIGAADRIPPAGRAYYFRFGADGSVPTVPFYQLFVPDAWRKNLKNGAIFKNKIVVIGPAASRLQDFHNTPVKSRLEGPLVHINAIAAALNGAFYEVGSSALKAAITFLMSCIAFAVAARIRSPITGMVGLVVVSIAYLGVTYGILWFANFIMPVRQPIMILLAAGVFCIAWNFAQARRESSRMRSMLDRYVSRNLVREVLENREDFLSRLGGTRQPVTVFFSDVRGFTSFSESADASAVVEQLNEYLGEMVGVIFRHNGTVDKFMGDGIMAVWGNVVSGGPALDTASTIRAALEMQERIHTLNTKWRLAGLKPFSVGMGIHHGEAVFGNIGSNEKMEPTVIGDTVNLASRVEGLTKKYGVPICLTQPAAELVSDQFPLRAVDLVQVVGKTRPVEIFTVLGRHDIPVPDWLTRYEGAVADFRARRFADAVVQFRLCVADAPEDKLCAIYLERAERFLAEPPPEDWTGTEVATSK